MPHRPRERMTGATPAHVTVKLRTGLPTLRSGRCFGVVLGALRGGCLKRGFRIVQFSVQRDHLHMIVEANNRMRLARGMQGFGVRIAKALNKHWGRKGSVYADRFHSRLLATPSEVRNALRYVLLNCRRHGAYMGRRADRYSSAIHFRDWGEAVELPARAWGDFLPRARSWLLARGWKRRGRLAFSGGAP